jgi:hypothetical protein
MCLTNEGKSVRDWICCAERFPIVRKTTVQAWRLSVKKILPQSSVSSAGYLWSYSIWKLECIQKIKPELWTINCVVMKTVRGRTFVRQFRSVCVCVCVLSCEGEGWRTLCYSADFLTL